MQSATLGNLIVQLARSVNCKTPLVLQGRKFSVELWFPKRQKSICHVYSSVSAGTLAYHQGAKLSIINLK